MNDRYRGETVETDIFVNKDLYRFFYLSFRFSQGVPSAQYRIFSWAGTQGFYPNVSKTLPKDFQEKFKIPFLHKDPRTMNAPDVNREWKKQWEVMHQKLSDPGTTSAKSFIKAITMHMIDSDLAYMYKNRLGRDVGSKFAEADSDQDPHSSFVRRYAIMLKSTGHPVFDKMFLEISKELNNKSVRKDQKTTELAKKWEQIHEGQDFFAD